MFFPHIQRNSLERLRPELEQKRAQDQSISTESHFKTFDTSSAFLTARHPVKKPFISTSRVDLLLRGKRSRSLDRIIHQCKSSFRISDQTVKIQLAKEQLHIQSLLKELWQPQKQSLTSFNVKSRRKFLQNEQWLSRVEVRKLMAKNRIEFKRARVLAIEN